MLRNCLLIMICTTIVAPFIAIIFTAVGVSDYKIFAHFYSVLPIYSLNSLTLVLGVVSVSVIFALPAALLVVQYTFPGSKFFAWALVLPLVIPGYISAYIYTDFSDYGGLIYNIYVLYMGTNDGYSFNIRNMYGAVFVMALNLFPYIFVMTKTRFMAIKASYYQQSQILGVSNNKYLFRIA